MGIFQRIIHDWPGRVPDAVYGAGRLGGVVPTWLNELVPANARAVLPGFVYQLGNLLASVNATLQARIAETHGGNYGLAMAIVAGAVAYFNLCICGIWSRDPGSRHLRYR
ncbi:metabolite transport protein [Salmonella enterica subsp. enterica]|nr:metabolite transport protein [Salmonella enterica subsp. enterica]